MYYTAAQIKTQMEKADTATLSALHGNPTVRGVYLEAIISILMERQGLYPWQIEQQQATARRLSEQDEPVILHSIPYSVLHNTTEIVEDDLTGRRQSSHPSARRCRCGCAGRIHVG